MTLRTPWGLLLLVLSWGLVARAQAGELPPVLRLEDGRSELKYDEASEQFSRTLWITSLNTTPVTDLRVNVTPLRDSAGFLHALEARLGTGGTAPQTVAGLERLSLTLSARLPRGGTYEGVLTLLYGNHPYPVPLKVVRPRAPLGVTVAPLSPARAWSGEQARLRLTLLETAGQSPNVQLAISALDQKEKGTAFQASFGETGGQPAPVPSAIPLEPYTSSTQLVTLPLTDGPGEYSGVLRLSSGNAVPQDVAFTLLVRDPWYCALAWILVGIVVSFLLREYATRRRPLLVHQRAGSLLLESLEDGHPQGVVLDARAMRVRAGLIEQVWTWLGRLRAGDDKDMAAEQVRLESKRELFLRWVTLHDRVSLLEPYSVKTQFIVELAQVERVLLDPSAAEDTLKAQRELLDTMPDRLDTALRGMLAEGLRQMDEELAGPQVVGTVPLAKVLEGTELLKRLQESKTALGEGELGVAVRAYNNARQAYAAGVMEWLGGMLESSQPPEGIPVPRWGELKTRLQDLLLMARQQLQGGVIEAAVASYQSVRSALLQAQCEALLESVKASQGKGEALAGLEEVEALLKTALQQVKDEKLTEAGKSYQDAYKKFAALPGVGQRLVPPSPPLVPAGAALRATPLALPVPRAPPPGLPSQRMLSRQLLWGDVLVSVVIFLVAGLMGLVALWMDTPTWGGLGSYTAALLWGLGLHQVAFQGLTQLRAFLLDEKPALGP